MDALSMGRSEANEEGNCKRMGLDRYYTRAFDSNFQITTMAVNTTRNLFNAPIVEEYDNVEAKEVDSDLPMSK